MKDTRSREQFSLFIQIYAGNIVNHLRDLIVHLQVYQQQQIQKQLLHMRLYGIER